jgi:cell division transport system permease protein
MIERIFWPSAPLESTVLRFFNRLNYLLKETRLGLQRGGWMNWAAVSTVTVLLFLFGISLQASWQLEGLLNQFGSQLEVSVYLETGVTAATLKPLVAQMPAVVHVEGVSKEMAWAHLVQELGVADIKGATQQLEGNPLVDELRVQARSSAEVPALAQQLRAVNGVADVQYIDEVVQRLAQLNRGLGWVTLGMTSLLTLSAIAVINTTISLIVMARRREIEVMQLVGATSRWIYFPFILQGVFFGVVGAAIAWLLIYTTQRWLQNLLANQPELIQLLAQGLQLNSLTAAALPLILIGFGGAVGLMGSLFAVRRVGVK